MHALETARLALRPLGPADRDRLRQIFRDPYVRRYLWDAVLVSWDEVDAVIAGSEASFRARGIGVWRVAERARPDDPIGFAGARPMATGELELIYGFLPAHWGRGFATEVALVVLARSFAAGERRMWAGTDRENKSSERVMRRLGMRFDRRETVAGLPQVYYVLDRADFRG